MRQQVGIPYLAIITEATVFVCLVCSVNCDGHLYYLHIIKLFVLNCLICFLPWPYEVTRKYCPFAEESPMWRDEVTVRGHPLLSGGTTPVVQGCPAPPPLPPRHVAAASAGGSLFRPTLPSSRSKSSF